MGLQFRQSMKALAVAAWTVTAPMVAFAASAPSSIAFPQERTTDAAISDLFARNDASTLPRPASLSQLRPLYEARGFAPIWSGSADADARAQTVLGVLAHAADEGLDPGDYPCTRLPVHPAAGAGAATYDIALSADLVRYARDVRLGRLAPSSVYRDVELPLQNFDAVGQLASGLKNGSLAQFLAELPPTHPEYTRLRPALAHYRALAAAGGWTNIPGSTEIKFPDDQRVSMLARRLAVEDATLDGIAAPTREDLDAALRRFQARNGLTVDGRAGKATLAALNVSAQTRVAQIEANMERWRWMPRQFEPRYIEVNVPDESLKLVTEGTTALTSRVIVGRKGNPTPILRAQAVAVTANPPWNVPRSIAVKEILPKLRRDPNYLVKENMILVNGPPGDPQGRQIDWRKMSAAGFPYQIRQVPGSQNALGSLKLELPNDFNVYLHDTPGKAAFSRDDRALSHGCIRVQQIFPLASLALGGDEAAMQMLSAAIASGTTQKLALREPLPIYVLYWTAMANDDGTVAFRPDLYGRDHRLMDTLAGAGPGRLALYTGDCGQVPG